MLVLEIFDVGKSLSLERGRRREERQGERGGEVRARGWGERDKRVILFPLFFSLVTPFFSLVPVQIIITILERLESHIFIHVYATLSSPNPGGGGWHFATHG